MIKFEQPKQPDSIIKIIGVGGGGNNAVQYMHKQGIGGVDFIACNTDKQVLDGLDIPLKVQLGKELTNGLGAGGDPEKGKQAAEESEEELKKMLQPNTKLAFIASGMGGGTGTGASPVIAKICRDLGIITIGVVTMPFSFECIERHNRAQEGRKNLSKQVDTLIVINNEKIKDFYGDMPIVGAFNKVDEVLNAATQSITSIIGNKGLMNLDFADICTVVKDGGTALIGQARKRGEDRIEGIVEETLNCPLLDDNDITGAQKMIVNLTVSNKTSPTQGEVDAICQEIVQRTGGNGKVDMFFGLAVNDDLGEDIQLTIIATGFQHKEEDIVPPPVEKKILLYPESPKTNEPASQLPHIPLHHPLPTSLAPFMPDTSRTENFSPENPSPANFSKQDTPPQTEMRVGEYPLGISGANTGVSEPVEEDANVLQSFVQQGEAERERKRAEQLQNYSTHLPLDFENPNSSAYANAYERRGYGEPYQWDASSKDLGTSMLKKDDDGNVHFSTENKFIDGNTPD